MVGGTVASVVVAAAEGAVDNEAEWSNEQWLT